MSKAFDNLMKKAFNEDINVTRSQADNYFKSISKHFNGDGSYKINGKHNVTINTKDFGDIQINFTEGKDMNSIKVDSVTVNGKTEKVSKEINSIKDVPNLFQGMDILFGGRVKGSKSSSSSSSGKKYKPETKEELKKLCDDLSINLGDIDTSLITDMSDLFKDSERTNEQFKGIETWDVSNVENMENMFNNAESFNKDISSWNINNVQYKKDMFNNCPIKEEYKPGAKPKASNNEEPEVSSSEEESDESNKWVEIKHCCVGTILDPNTTPSLQVILDLLNQEDLGFHFTKENTRGGGLAWYFFIAGGYKALVFGLSDGVEILADEETAQNVYENLKRVIDRTFKYSRRIKIRDEDDLHSALSELSGFLVEGETLSENDIVFDGDEEEAEEFAKIIGISAYQLMKEKHDGLSYILDKGNPEWHDVKESFKSYSNSIFGRILERVY